MLKCQRFQLYKKLSGITRGFSQARRLTRHTVTRAAACCAQWLALPARPVHLPAAAASAEALAWPNLPEARNSALASLGSPEVHRSPKETTRGSSAGVNGELHCRKGTTVFNGSDPGSGAVSRIGATLKGIKPSGLVSSRSTSGGLPVFR